MLVDGSLKMKQLTDGALMVDSFGEPRTSVPRDRKINYSARSRGCDGQGTSLTSNMSYRMAMPRDMMQSQSDPYYAIRLVKLSSSF
jgi:hypothetical protein